MEEKRKKAKKILAIIVFCAVCVLIGAAVLQVGLRVTNYKSTAIEYFKAEAETDWQKTYALLEVSDSEFVSLDGYVEMNKNQPVINIESCTAEYADNDKIADIYATDKPVRSVVVTYTVSGDNTERTRTLDVVKTDEKYFKIFSQYKIILATDKVVPDYTVRIPKDATLTLDGIQVDAKYLHNDNDAQETDVDTYVIDYLFCGDHTIQITQDNMEDFTQTIRVDAENTAFSKIKLTLKKEVLQELASKGENDIRSIYGAIIVNTTYDNLPIPISDSENEKAAMAEIYDSFMQEQHATDGYGLTELFWTQVSGDGSQVTIADGGTRIKVMLDASYVASIKSQYSTGDKTLSKTGSMNAAIWYVYNNNTWKIYNMELSKIY